MNRQEESLTGGEKRWQMVEVKGPIPTRSEASHNFTYTTLMEYNVNHPFEKVHM